MRTHREAVTARRSAATAGVLGFALVLGTTTAAASSDVARTQHVDESGATPFGSADLLSGRFTNGPRAVSIRVELRRPPDLRRVHYVAHLSSREIGAYTVYVIAGERRAKRVLLARLPDAGGTEERMPCPGLRGRLSSTARTVTFVVPHRCLGNPVRSVFLAAGTLHRKDGHHVDVVSARWVARG